MKILHTSDWHLGHRLHENSQHDEQVLFLGWLIEHINTNGIDILLISGDIFDTGVPSTQSQKLYYDFLVDVTKTTCKHVVITGGNHDAPGTINAPKELLNSLSVYVVGKASENIADEVFELWVNNEKVIIAAVPYLRDQDIRRAIAGETFEEISDRYKNALINHYNSAAEYCKTLKTNDTPILAMGHLFAIGGSTSDSEQSIYVGNLGDIGANDFNDIFDYIALGHLHRSQKIGDNNHIRYSGSPYILSFSEVNTVKKIVVIETQNTDIKNIEEIDIPHFRDIYRISGSVNECISRLQKIESENHALTPWVEVVLNNDSKTTIGNSEINNTANKMNLEVLKISFKHNQLFTDNNKLFEKSKKVKDLTPIEVFKMKCNDQDFSIDKNPDILDAFNEALQIVRNG